MNTRNKKILDKLLKICYNVFVRSSKREGVMEKKKRHLKPGMKEKRKAVIEARRKEWAEIAKGFIPGKRMIGW